MNEKATCPHCDTKFEPQNHHESGAYKCHECHRGIFVEVDYLYRARCAEQDHKWTHSKGTPIQLLVCEYCREWKEDAAVQTSASLTNISAEEGKW